MSLVKKKLGKLGQFSLSLSSLVNLMGYEFGEISTKSGALCQVDRSKHVHLLAMLGV